MNTVKYWLDVKGKLIPAGDSHENAAKSIVKGGNTAEAFRSLLSRGYLRVVVRGKQIFYNGTRRPNAQQQERLIEWAQQDSKELLDDSKGRPQIVWTPVEGGMTAYERRSPRRFVSLLEYTITHIKFSEVPVGKWFSGYGPGWNKYTKYKKTGDRQAKARDGRAYTATEQLFDATVEAYL